MEPPPCEGQTAAAADTAADPQVIPDARNRQARLTNNEPPDEAGHARPGGPGNVHRLNAASLVLSATYGASFRTAAGRRHDFISAPPSRARVRPGSRPLRGDHCETPGQMRGERQLRGGEGDPPREELDPPGPIVRHSRPEEGTPGRTPSSGISSIKFRLPAGTPEEADNPTETAGKLEWNRKGELEFTEAASRRTAKPAELRRSGTSGRASGNIRGMGQGKTPTNRQE